jgi:hypothetical protein
LRHRRGNEDALAEIAAHHHEGLQVGRIRGRVIIMLIMVVLVILFPGMVALSIQIFGRF